MDPKRIVFVGDFCPVGRQVHNSSQVWAPFAAMKRIFGEDSLIVANLECPLTEQTAATPYKWANLRASPHVLPVVKGLDIAALGNNHISDFSSIGAEETTELLASIGVRTVGYGRNIEEACKPIFVDLCGRKVGILNLCCPTTNGQNLATHRSEGVAPLGMRLLQQAIEGARSKCHGLLVYLHWGPEWVHSPTPSMMRMARRAIDAGADGVVGCHSHTIQCYEQYCGRWIFYGLGNFFFGDTSLSAVGSDGQNQARSPRLGPANRESIAVSFGFSSRSGQLELERTEYLCQESDLLRCPAPTRVISFDINAANASLLAYARRHRRDLEDSSEPLMLCEMRDGIPSITYADSPIPVLPRRSSLALMLRRGVSACRHLFR